MTEQYAGIQVRQREVAAAMISSGLGVVLATALSHPAEIRWDLSGDLSALLALLFFSLPCQVLAILVFLKRLRGYRMRRVPNPEGVIYAWLKATFANLLVCYGAYMMFAAMGDAATAFLEVFWFVVIHALRGALCYLPLAYFHSPGASTTFPRTPRQATRSRAAGN